MFIRVSIISCLILIAIGCGKKEEKKSDAVPTSNFKAGLVFDVGGRGDKSFNDAAYNGLELAKKELGIESSYVEPGEGADREAALRQLASTPDVKIIFGIGFIFTDDITNVAKEFPEKKFVCIDYSVDTTKKIPDNLLAITFKEEEGSFLVGALAALTSKTGTIGFVGGMDSPLIKKFERGYTAGAKYAIPKCEVLSGYAGLTGEGFKNPAKGKELALVQYKKNADVIFHASGVTGLGVFEAARDENAKGKKVYVIGVDKNQENEAPGLVLTSMVKVVDHSVFEEVKNLKANTFKGGIVKELDLKNSGVDYIFNDVNRPLISAEAHEKVEAIRKKIISGEIQP